MAKNPHRRTFLLILVLSFLLMLIVLNLPFKAKPFGDITFHEEAKTMALFLKGELPASEVKITKAPGPVIFFTLPYLIAPADSTDDEFWVYGISFTGIVLAIAMLLIYRTASAFFSREIGLLTIFLFFIFPIHYYYSLGIIGEGAAFSSLALMLYGWSKAYYHPQLKSGWLYIAIGFLFMILNRPNTMLMFAVLAIVLVYAYFRNRKFLLIYGKKLALTFVAVGIAGFTILQAAKNITGNSDSQDNLLYYVMHQGRFQFREEPTDFRFWDNTERADSKDYQNWVKNTNKLYHIIKSGEKSYKDAYRDFVIQDALDHPYWFVRQFFVKCFYGNVYLINSIEPEDFKLGPFKGAAAFTGLIVLINIINVAIITGLIIFLIREPHQLRYWPFWGIILALLIFHGLTYMEPRYLFPSKVAVYILGAAGLYRISAVRNLTNRVASYLYPKPR